MKPLDKPFSRSYFKHIFNSSCIDSKDELFERKSNVKPIQKINANNIKTMMCIYRMR